MALHEPERCWIMVIADDAPTRDAITDALNFASFPTIGVPNAHAAREWLGSSQADPVLIILEGEQNVLDGLHLRDLRQADPHAATVPVVVVAASADELIQRPELATESVEVLPKPANTDRLVALATQYCQTLRQRSSHRHG